MKSTNTQLNTLLSMVVLLLFIFPPPTQALFGEEPITIHVSMISTIPQDVEAEIEITNLDVNEIYFLHYNLFDLIEFGNGEFIHNQSISSSEMYGPYTIDESSENVTPTIQWQSSQITSDVVGYRLYVFISDDEYLQVNYTEDSVITPEVFDYSSVDFTIWTDEDGDDYWGPMDMFPFDVTEWNDEDGDGHGDNSDLFDNDLTQWSDIDGDERGDNPLGNNPDTFPNEPTQWSDSDGDGYGDNWGQSAWNNTRIVAWPGEFVVDAVDADYCPTEYGTSTQKPQLGCEDIDGDGISDLIDTIISLPNDDDGDGISNNEDQCPDTPLPLVVNEEGCEWDGEPVDTNPDIDFDGVANELDSCPGTPLNSNVSSNGCLSDFDQDGIPDDEDACPDTIPGGMVHMNGCERDDDQDGIPNAGDDCQYSRLDRDVDENGCEIIIGGDSLVENFIGDVEEGGAVTQTVGASALILALLGFLQTNFIAAMLPDSLRWLQFLRKGKRLSSEEEQELLYLQSVVQTYHEEEELLKNELEMLAGEISSRYVNKELKKLTRDTVLTIIANLRQLPPTSLKAIANDPTYFGLTSGMKAKERSELLEQDKAFIDTGRGRKKSKQNPTTYYDDKWK